MESSIVCFLWGPTHEYRREPAGERWCFVCRKRYPHEDILMGEPPPPDDPEGFEKWLDDGYGYYEPSWSRRCTNCHQEAWRFPGRD